MYNLVPLLSWKNLHLKACDRTILQRSLNSFVVIVVACMTAEREMRDIKGEARHETRDTRHERGARGERERKLSGRVSRFAFSQ